MMHDLGDEYLKKAFALWVEMLKKSVQDQYRGHADLNWLISKIDEKAPMYGGNITINKQDPKTGQFYTVTHKVLVLDDLRHPINGPEDIGGQCMKGEVVKKGYLYTCLECGNPFCRRHVKFVDNDSEKPLCRYGRLGWSGCYMWHWKEYSNKYGAQPPPRSPEAIPDVYEPRRALPSVKSRKASILSIPCPNPICEGGYIKMKGVLCLNCRATFSVYEGEHLSCPHCGSGVIQCPHCEAEIEL